MLLIRLGAVPVAEEQNCIAEELHDETAHKLQAHSAGHTVLTLKTCFRDADGAVGISVEIFLNCRACKALDCYSSYFYSRPLLILLIHFLQLLQPEPLNAQPPFKLRFERSRQ